MRRTAWAIVVFVLLWLVLYPNLFVVRDSLASANGFSVANYTRFFDSAAELRALSLDANMASALSAAIGIPLAFFFTRLEFPGRRVLGALVSLPVLLPPLVGVIAFMFLYGETGFLTRAVQVVLHLQNPPWRLNGAGAVLLVHAYTMYVYFYLFVSAGLARLDSSVLEAAAALGASRRRTWLRVVLPMLAPAIGGAALLVFMTSMGSFSAPYVFGGGFRVLTTQIFASKLNGDLGIAAVETVILAISSIVFLLWLQRYEAGRSYTGATKGTGVAFQADRYSRRARWSLTLAGAAIALFLILPHLTVLLVSFVPEGSWTTEFIPPRYSLDSYRQIFTNAQTLRPIINSFSMAAWATIANVVFALMAGYLLARGTGRGKRLVDALVVLPWALPGTVLAIALAATFSVNQPLAGRFVLVGTSVILPLAYFIRNIPLVTRATMASSTQFDPALEEALKVLGNSALVAPKGIVIAEHRTKRSIDEVFGTLKKYRSAKYGDTTLSFYA